MEMLWLAFTMCCVTSLHWRLIWHLACLLPYSRERSIRLKRVQQLQNFLPSPHAFLSALLCNVCGTSMLHSLLTVLAQRNRSCG